MASTYSDLNYTMDLTLLKDQLEPEFPMPDDYSTPDEFAEEETALLDGFVTDYGLITDLRYEETIKVTNEDVPVPHVVMKVEPFSEDDSGIQSQVSLSDNSEDELLPSKENSEDEPLLAKETSFNCELNHSTENIPEYNIIVIQEGRVKFQIEEYEDGEEDQEKMKNGINYRIDKIKDQPVTSSFYQRKMLECQSSVSFNMDDIHSGSSDDTQDTYLTLGTVDSTDTICQSLLPWRRDDDDIERAEMPKAALVEQKSEAWYRIAIEICLPFLMSGFGCIMAGYVLGIVQHWNVFVKVSEIFILVPALLGLKGNLEMTLASRLSTQANIGNMDDPREQWKMIGGNLALTQAQAVVVGFLAAIAAMLLAWIPEGKFDIHHAFLLCASSVLTAALASLILGSVMIAVVLLSRKCKINPDNVATPIAASLGDLTTLALLSALANFFWNSLGGNRVWIAPTFLCIALVLTPLWCYISYKNKYVKEVLISGWSPVIGAMMISSVGGLILDFAVATYHGIAVFQPVINGVGGNLVAVQASRLSTALHQNSKPGVLPDDAPQACPNPCTTFFGKGANGRTARVLLLLVIPGHLIFIYTISYMQAGHTSITPVFASVYLTAAMLQVIALLYLANWLVHWLWKRGNDPDNFSIPYLTALGDLLGGALLAIAFHILYLVGDKDADVGD